MKTSYEDFLKRVRNNDIVGASDSLKASAVNAYSDQNATNSKSLENPAGSLGSLSSWRKTVEMHPQIFRNVSPEYPPRGFTPEEWREYRRRHFGTDL